MPFPIGVFPEGEFPEGEFPVAGATDAPPYTLNNITFGATLSAARFRYTLPTIAGIVKSTTDGYLIGGQTLSEADVDGLLDDLNALQTAIDAAQATATAAAAAATRPVTIYPTGTKNGTNLTFTLPYALSWYRVYVNGIMTASTAYSISGTTLTLVSGTRYVIPNSTDDLWVDGIAL